MMMPSAMVLLLAAAGGVIDAARTRADAGRDDACPDEVSENSRGDCVDVQQQMLPPKCCEEMRWCRAEVERRSDIYVDGFMQYVEKCSISEEDLNETEEGYELVNDSALCSAACQANAESFNAEEMPGYEDLDERCGRFEMPEAEVMRQRYGMTVLLRDSFEACTEKERQPLHIFIKTKVIETIAAAVGAGAEHLKRLWHFILHVPNGLHEFFAGLAGSRKPTSSRSADMGGRVD